MVALQWANHCRQQRSILSMQVTRTRHSAKSGCEDKPPSTAGLAITCRSIDALKPDPANPRRHSRKQIRQIASSIESFGFAVSVLIDADDKVARRIWKAVGLPGARQDRSADASPRTSDPGRRAPL